MLNESIDTELFVVSKPKANSNLHKAKAVKNDEFYTQNSDITSEMEFYKKQHFKDKVILCNCDDPAESEFHKVFKRDFKHFGLKGLITTHYAKGKKSYALKYTLAQGKTEPTVRRIELQGDGDFRSPECVALLKEADIVVTNPPFSLFREYIAQLLEHDKKFIVLGALRAATYRDIFVAFQENKIWLGAGNPKEFLTKEGDMVSVRVKWFTNLTYKKRKSDVLLFRKYSPEEYPKYDNYDAINVDKTCDIPEDYFGEMGVPISFLDYYDPKQFEIVGVDIVLTKQTTGKTANFILNGAEKYKRIVIKRK